MIFSPRSSRSLLFPALRGSSGLALLLVGACTVGIDDRPVPPEAIPGAALQETSASAEYGAPQADADGPITRAQAPAYSTEQERSGSGDLVWRTGAQPVADGGTSFAAPEPASGETDVASDEEGASPGEDAASVEPQQGERVAALTPEEAHSFRFAPLVGLDRQAAAPLREAMETEAQNQSIRLSDGPEKLVLKGYLSSMEDGGATVLTYVWDVYDTAGNRLTRIEGQQKLPRAARGGPLSVDDATARLVAARTVAALARWQPDGAV